MIEQKTKYKYFKPCAVCGEGNVKARCLKELENKLYCSCKCSGIAKKLPTKQKHTPGFKPPPEGVYKRFGTKYLVYQDGRIWKEGHYTTRSDGVERYWKAKWMPTRVRKPKDLNNPLSMGAGYSYIDLDGKTYLVHRVVATVFIPNIDNLPEVNHINGKRSDNRVENLEWVSSSDNKNHSLFVLKRKRSQKLSDKDYEDIRYLRNVKGLPLKDIASKYNIVFQTVSDIAHENRFIFKQH